MTVAEMADLGKLGGASMLALAAFGSALGAGAAAPAAIGAWKKCYAHGKTPPFMLLAFIGAPLSQTIYGMIIMNRIANICSVTTYLSAEAIAKAKEAAKAASVPDWLSFIPPDTMQHAEASLMTVVSSWHALLGVGFFGGLAMGASAWMQGRAGAAAADALAETGQGAGNYLMALGIIETVAIFVLVFIGKVIG
jgi:V/A-type H+-transporting ATPase subunit K